MIAKTKEVLKKLEFGLLELFIGFFMIIGLIGYFGRLPADFDWIDHTVAFLMFSYFFYILNITSILFGKTNKAANLLLVVSFFSLFFKDVISYTEANAFKFKIIMFVDNFYAFFSNNLSLTNFATFYFGVAGILIVSIYLTKKIEISHPSFLYAIAKNHFKNGLMKFIAIFLSLLSFYYFVYNPILEWLEFVLDDPIVLVGIIFFAVTIAKHHYKFHKKHIIFRIGNLVWGWYRRFISLFHYKKTLPLAISGLLILHALSDLGVFAYSLVFFKENFYLEFLRDEHVPFLKLFLSDLKIVPSSVGIPLLIAYLLNALSLIIFLLIPIIVWVRMFSQKELHFKRIFLFFIYSSSIAYILLPGYIIKPLDESSITGVDILSIPLLESSSILDDFFPNKSTIIISVSLISIITGLVVYILSSNSKAKRELYAISIIGGLTFYTIYLYYFFSSLLIYFYDNILLTVFTPHFVIGAVLAVLLILSVVFYIGGYMMFLYEIVMEYHKRKWSEPIDEELVVAIRKIKSVKKKMISSKKAQIIGEVFKYGMVGVVSIVILIAGYNMVNVVKERACKTEIAKFEIDLRNIDKSLRFGTKELQSYDVPCKVDKIYFFDLNKTINPENFKEIPIIKDTLKSKGNNNIFLVKEGDVKRSFYAGNLEMVYPYNICFLPKFDKISFFIEGAGKSAKIAAACNQPECTFIPIDISESDSREIIKEAFEFACPNCPKDFDKEIESIKLTRQNVEMFRKFSFCDGITDVQIIIKPKKGLEVKDFRFYEFIPKNCIDDLENYLVENIEGDVDIKGDPLIMWHFEDLSEEQKISYKLSTELNEECKKAIQGLGVTQFIKAEEPKEELIKENTAPTIGGLPDATVTGVQLHKGVIRNLWKYAQDRETDSRELLYDIILQTRPELVDCSISSEKNLDCEVKQNKDGISSVTIDVSDREFQDRASFNVEVTQFCKSHVRKDCLGNQVIWLDSCGNQQDLQKVCASNQKCEDGECKQICVKNSARKCSGNKVYWYDSCNNRGKHIYNCEKNTGRRRCKDGKCCLAGGFLCETPKEEDEEEDD